MRNSRFGCNCGNKPRMLLGQANIDQYGNVTNYDEYYDTASATVENIWNDLEGAGVWAGNEVSSVWNSVRPFTPAGAASAGAYDAQHDTGPLSAVADTVCAPNASNPNQPLPFYCQKGGGFNWGLIALAGLAAIVIIKKV